MTTFIGSPLTPLTVGLSPTYAQSYCTLNELDEDLNLLGSEREARVMPKIKTASDFLMKNIGWFMPVTMTQYFQGKQQRRLYLPPLLSITQIINDETILGATDIIAQPQAKYWPNGPYAWIDIDPDAVNVASWSCEENDITITGKWGLYNLASSMDITTGASQTAGASTLQVSNGADVSPGLVALINDEQEYVESTGTPTSEVTTISAAIADSEVQTITFTNGALVNVGEVLRIDLEQMKLVDISGHTGAVVRGWNRTQKASHLINAHVDVYRTFNVVRGVNGTTAAIHDNGTAIYRQAVPDDINMLCRKMAGRMLKDAQGGFSGVIGDPTMGTAQYLYILPKELADIKNAYRIIHTAR